jgi:hypothetical protein
MTDLIAGQVQVSFIGLTVAIEHIRSGKLRALAEPSQQDNAAYWREQEERWRVSWLSEHPGRTRAEYNRLLRDHDSELWEWRRAKGRAANDAERLAWERDHPGQKYPEHECGLSDRAYTDLERWRRQQEREQRKAAREKSRTAS